MARGSPHHPRIQPLHVQRAPAAGQAVEGGLVEPLGPVEAAALAGPVDAAQVVHDVAAAHDQHAALSHEVTVSA